MLIKEAAIKKETKQDEKQNAGVKSKEERLRELKGLYEKELITKEEYERVKQKILDEL